MTGTGGYGTRPRATVYADPGVPPFMADPDNVKLLACTGAPKPEVFFPTYETKASTSAAKAICSHCPFQVDCRRWALRQSPHDLHGVWGGTNKPERLKFHRQLQGRRSAALR